MIERQEINNSTINTFIGSETNGSKILLHGVQFIFIALLLGCLSIIRYNSDLIYWTCKVLQLTTFAAAGILHLYLANSRLLSFNKNLLSKSLKFSFVLSLLVCLVLFLLYSFTATHMLVMSLASGCAFLLPSIVFNSWELFKTFYKQEYKVWYNYKNINDNRVTIYLNSISVNIKLKRRYFDVEDELFPITLPGHVAIGRLFNEFLIELNEDNSIEVLDERGNPYGWLFFVERRGGRKYIDPELTLRENKLKDNATIVAKRVKRKIELAYRVAEE